MVEQNYAYVVKIEWGGIMLAQDEQDAKAQIIESYNQEFGIELSENEIVSCKLVCSCCHSELSDEEKAEGAGKCFPCLKGNCPQCG